MTREEAIGELKYAQAMCEFDPSTGEIGFRNDEDRKQHEAFGMAIEALKERKTGRWIKKKNIMLGDYIECSLCKNAESRIAPGWWNLKKYCPNCGAKMEIEK